jgi:histone H3/H4
MATLQGQGTASAASAPSPAPTAPEPTELISKHKMSELLRHSSSHRMEPEVEEVSCLCVLELQRACMVQCVAAVLTRVHAVRVSCVSCRVSCRVSCIQVLLELADDFLENLISAGSVLAKHRGSDVLEVRDVALHMERAWDMRLPGYSDPSTLYSTFIFVFFVFVHLLTFSCLLCLC